MKKIFIQMNIRKPLGKFFKWISGWDYDPFWPEEKKCVILLAPHTSMWDFFHGSGFNLWHGKKPSIMVKKELFFFPLGQILKIVGGLPIDRRNASQLVESVISQFNNNKELTLVIAPEGTRQKVKVWKKGFYRIAKAANVPVYYGILDYKQKRVSIHPESFFVSDDAESDVKKVMSFYKQFHPKHPEKFYAGE